MPCSLQRFCKLQTSKVGGANSGQWVTWKFGLKLGTSGLLTQVCMFGVLAVLAGVCVGSIAFGAFVLWIIHL